MSDDYISVFDGMDKDTVDRILNRGKYRTQLIQKLEAENARLQGVLEEVLQWIEGHVVGWHDGPAEVTATGTSAAFEARVALEGKE